MAGLSDRFLSFSNDKATNFPVTAVATEWEHLSKSTEVLVDEDLNWEQARDAGASTPTP
ncbi:MAG: hypothetical protein WD205_08555 [Rhodothermales bacterium]